MASLTKEGLERVQRNPFAFEPIVGRHATMGEQYWLQKGWMPGSLL